MVKEEFKNILLMGLGAMSLTNEKAKELRTELLKKGNKIYEEGKVANEELKHNIENKIKDNVTIVVNKDITNNDIMDKVKTMSDEEKKELLAILTKEAKEESNNKDTNE